MIRNSVSDWQELSALYEEADVLDVEARSAWLATLRHQQHPLLSQLERMLQASSDARESRFLDAPATGIGLAQMQPSAALGLRIGAYRLLRPIGEGGMAEVWLAERDDGAFRRQVAIKLLHRQSFGIERSALALRFARERDILASLDHPHIAALHDAGVTADNQSWLALEYVEGKTLTAWCDDEKLTLQARVRLFQQVLLAVQHAHGKLVIHRDLKPANILVTPEGTVRLLDFGIAKLLQAEGENRGDSELTREGGRPLTLQYTSPEQLLGAPLTTASDVYSAGVVLYELLCGERPYELRQGSTAARLEDAILELEPRAPSRREPSPGNATLRSATPAQLRKLLAHDLDAVVLKALEKSPSKRYSSIEAMSADLDRWLQGKPVLSTAPSALHRAHKFVARHKVGVATAAAALAMLIGASGVAIWMAMNALKEERRAVASRDFLLSVFALANPEEGGVVDMSASQLLDVGRQKAMTELASQPKLQAEVLSGIASVQTLTGDYASAEKGLREAERIYVRLSDAKGALAAKVDLGDAQFRMGDLSSAKNSLSQADAALATVPASHAVRYKLASTHGWIAMQSGDIGTAQSLLNDSLREAELAFGRHHTLYVDALRDVAKADLQARDLSGAARHLARAEELAVGTPGITPSELIGLEEDRANVEFVSGSVLASTQRLTDTAEHCDKLLGAMDEECFIVRARLAGVLLRSGEERQALALVPYLTPRLTNNSSPKRQAEAATFVSRILARSGQLTASHPALMHLEAVAAGESGQQLSGAYQVNALLVLGEIAMAEGKSTEAHRRLERAIDTIARRRVSDSLSLGWSNNLEGLLLQSLGEDEAALAKFDQAKLHYSRQFGATHPLTALYGLHACTSLARLGRGEQAVGLIDSALPTLKIGMGEQSPLIERVTRLRARIVGSASKSAHQDPGAEVFM